MSGIEVAGLALGAVPVILETIKGYRTAYEHIQSLKQATRQLQIIDAQFRVCRINFLNECRLLLDLVLSADPHLAKEMVADSQHRLWQDHRIEQRLASVLKDNADACTTIVLDTSATVKDFDARLSKLLSSSKSNGGTLQRARASATFLLEKSRFERHLATLRSRNADMNLLRTQLTAFDSHARAPISIPGAARTAVGQFCKVRVASGMLYETLKQSWSCSDQTHLRHWVKLCIDSETESQSESVTLDMAIACDINGQGKSAVNRAIFWLYVRSDSTPSKGLPNPQRQNNQLEPLIQSLQTSSISLSPAQKPSTTTGPSNPPPLTSAEVDICKVTCLCSHFQLGTQKHESQPSVNCLGYLKSPSDCQYRFYPPVISRRFSETSSAALADEATTLIGLIDKSRSGPTELLHQYQLALMICRSVLQFHNTAWLPSNWRLQDISIFGTVLSDHTLKTLHLSTRFESSCTSGVPSREAQGTASHAETTRNTSNLSSVDACCRKLCPSVYNETLFSLGIALLEIAHWQSFQTLGRGDQDEVHAAHRIVRGPPPIGSKYRKVAERCLRCDFGVGSENLEDEDLQHAVWSKVIYPLEALIRDTSQEI